MSLYKINIEQTADKITEYIKTHNILSKNPEIYCLLFNTDDWDGNGNDEWM